MRAVYLSAFSTKPIYFLAREGLCLSVCLSVCVSMSTVVESDLKAPFSFAATRGRDGRNVRTTDATQLIPGFHSAVV